MSERLTKWVEMLARVRRTAKDEEGIQFPQLRQVVFESVCDVARDCPDALLDDSGMARPLPPECPPEGDWDVMVLPTSPYYDGAVEALAMFKLHAADALDVKQDGTARAWEQRYLRLTRGG